MEENNEKKSRKKAEFLGEFCLRTLQQQRPSVRQRKGRGGGERWRATDDKKKDRAQESRKWAMIGRSAAFVHPGKKEDSRGGWAFSGKPPINESHRHVSYLGGQGDGKKKSSL